MDLRKIKGVYDDAVSDLAGRTYEQGRDYGVAVYEIGRPSDSKSVGHEKIYVYYDGGDWVFRVPKVGAPSMCLYVKRQGGFEESQGHQTLSELFDEIGLTDRIKMFVSGKTTRCESCSQKGTVIVYKGDIPKFAQFVCCDDCAKSWTEDGYSALSLGECDVVTPGGLRIAGHTFDLVVPDLDVFKEKYEGWSKDPSTFGASEIRFANDFLESTKELVK